MKLRVLLLGTLLGMLSLIAAAALRAQDQEAGSGFELRGTFSGEALASPLLSPSGKDWAAEGGFRAVLYPTFKFNDNWSFTGAVQAFSYPYFFEFEGIDQGGVQGQLLEASVNYSRFWGNRSLTVRAGQLYTAFGSFLLRYDDYANPLIDMPAAYGYYWTPVSTAGVAGGEVDATLGKVDLRGQLTNSSPSNPQSVASPYQYLNWTAGGGYTIIQGLRVGTSVFRGPYLNAAEWHSWQPVAPAKFPATGIGVDVEWGRGPWNFSGEWGHFQMDQPGSRPATQDDGYVEARLVLNPRWYLATRIGTMRPNPGSPLGPPYQIYEAGAGFRPGAHELIKVEYEHEQGAGIHGDASDTLAVQVVTNLRLLSFSGSPRH